MEIRAIYWNKNLNLKLHIVLDTFKYRDKDVEIELKRCCKISERYPKVNWIIGSCIPKMKFLNHVKNGTGIVAYRGAGK